MDTLSIALIAVGLAMDAFSVATVAGFVIKRFSFKKAFKLSFHFGLFQFFMPLLGWFAGSTIASLIADFDHWVAFGLLILIGGKMVLEGSREKLGVDRSDPTGGVQLLMFSVATSIDALAVGLTFALSNVAPFHPSVLIGIVAAVFTLLGFYLGSKSSRFFGRYVEVMGGAILVLIGTRILVTHIL